MKRFLLFAWHSKESPQSKIAGWGSFIASYDNEYAANDAYDRFEDKYDSGHIIDTQSPKVWYLGEAEPVL